jgi:hypothetical protein
MPPWIQPVATVVGPVTASLIVLFGVVRTLRDNRRRLRNEQLEKRAKDKENRLQAAYADLVGAALLLLKHFVDVARLNYFGANIDVGQAAEMGMTLDEAETNIKKDKRKAWENIENARLKIATTYARLILIEEDEKRLLDTNLLYEDSREWTPDLAEEYEDELEEKLRKFCERIGRQLETQYRVEATLAEKGVGTPLTVSAYAEEEAQKITGPKPN